MPDAGDRPLEDREYPDEADLSDDDSADLEPCPACGELVYEGAPQCPYCREWMVGGGRTSKTLWKSWLFWLAVATVGAAAIAVRLLT